MKKPKPIAPKANKILATQILHVAGLLPYESSIVAFQAINLL